jgi:succinyl-CoA synthetase alpha subunit
MLVTSAEGVLVQGITGRQGRFWTARMAACGTRIVAGATPGKGGQTVDGIPVYDSAREAALRHQIEVSVLFVPPLEFADAALDALSAGIRKIVALTEHVPYQDVMGVLAEARDRGAQVLGPNTAGLVVPGAASVGIMPAFAAGIFRPGTVGVVSRSGSLGTLICWQLVRAGYGQSAFIGVGGDPILGTTILDAVRELDQHPATSAIVIVGEIGGTMEEHAASYIATMAKPVVALIAGRSAPAGRRMGHAGAIISGHTGSGAAKTTALRDAGATIIDIPGQLASALCERALVPCPAYPANSASPHSVDMLPRRR